MRKLGERFQSWSWESRLLAIFTAAALIPAFASLWPPSSGPLPAPAGVDTHIPKGFVLIPIEVQNFAALDSIFGRFGRVDLFRPDQTGAAKQPIAYNVRLIRAPQNPSLFAALVPEREASRILSHGGAFIVIVKPPGEGGTEFVKSLPKSRRKILYGGG